jgi:hypothetical protein
LGRGALQCQVAVEEQPQVVLLTRLGRGITQAEQPLILTYGGVMGGDRDNTCRIVSKR